MSEIIQMISPYGVVESINKIVNTSIETVSWSFGNILKIDNDYTFSVWLKSDNNTTTEIGISTDCKIYPVTNKWQKFVFTAKSCIDISNSVYFTIPPNQTLYAFEGQLEEGTICSAWSPSPKDMSEDLSDLHETITNQYQSELNILRGEISTLVSKITGVENSYSTISKELSTQIMQSAENISMVTKSISEVTDKLTGKVTKEEIIKWADFNGEYLSLGTNRDIFSVRLSRDELGFYEGSNKVAYISNKELYIKMARVLYQLAFGPEGQFIMRYDDDLGIIVT